MKAKHLLKEPLLHFFVLGAALFVLFASVNDDSMLLADKIVIDEMRVHALLIQFERVWQRPPTPEELSGLVDGWVREEILYREGLALGLDRDDPVLRRRVAQKMSFISETLAERLPTDAELQDFFERNAGEYTFEPRFSFRQLYFKPTMYGRSLDVAVARSRQALENGDESTGDSTMLPTALENVSQSYIGRIFGKGYAQALVTLPIGEWAGPVESDYGVHLVRIDESVPARAPPLEEVRTAVERDWLAERMQEAQDAVYRKLRQRYRVVYSDDVEIADRRNAGGTGK